MRADSGRILGEDECKALLILPVQEFTEEGSRSPHWLKGRGTAHPLDKLVPVGLLIQREAEKLSPALAEETERMKLRTNAQKAALARKLDGLEVQVKALETEREAVTGDRLKRLALEKQTTQLRRELMRGREDQFFDAMRLDMELEEQVMLSPEFMELWGKIKQKTTYRVSIDTERLVENCVKALREMPRILRTRLISQTADVHVEQAGIYHTEREMRTFDVGDFYQLLPDLITVISDEALLTPATVNRILQQSGRCKEFLDNPEAFLEKAVEIIRDNRHALAIDGISYIKLDGEEYYAQEIFDSAELLVNLDRNAVKVEHNVYDYIVYDSSSVERPFALALDHDPDVKMFFKIPSRFKIETPIGTYNPDWGRVPGPQWRGKTVLRPGNQRKHQPNEAPHSGTVKDSLREKALRSLGKWCGDAGYKKLDRIQRKGYLATCHVEILFRFK